MRNYNHETTPDFITTYTPARRASLESDVFVPVLQGIAVGVSVGILGGVATLLLGGPIAHLQGGTLWAWAGRLAGVSFALGLSGSVVAFVLGHRRAIWQRERRLNRDLDGDGEIGEPDTVRVELVSEDGKTTKYTDLPVSMDELQAVAVAILKNNRPFSRDGLRGIVSQGKFNRLAKRMEKRGLCIKHKNNHRELTRGGKALLRSVLPK